MVTYDEHEPRAWTVAEAKAKLSEVLRRAEEEDSPPFCKALERVRRARVARGRPEDTGTEACRVGDPLGGVVMTTRPTSWQSTDRDSRSHAGAAPRRPSAGVAVVRRAGPLQRGRGRARRRSMS